MNGVETSYLLAWAAVATILVVAGGLGHLLAIGALLCGAHRAHLWRALPATHVRRAFQPSHPTRTLRSTS